MAVEEFGYLIALMLVLCLATIGVLASAGTVVLLALGIRQDARGLSDHLEPRWRIVREAATGATRAWRNVRHEMTEGVTALRAQWKEMHS